MKAKDERKNKLALHIAKSQSMLPSFQDITKGATNGISHSEREVQVKVGMAHAPRRQGVISGRLTMLGTA
jgi:hypothetical protein